MAAMALGVPATETRRGLGAVRMTIGHYYRADTVMARRSAVAGAQANAHWAPAALGPCAREVAVWAAVLASAATGARRPAAGQVVLLMILTSPQSDDDARLLVLTRLCR